SPAAPTAPLTHPLATAVRSTPLPSSLQPPRPPRSALLPYTTLFRSAKFTQVPYPGGSKAAPALLGGEVDCYFASTSNFLRMQGRSEEHTSELQSRFDLVCRLLLEKKKQTGAWVASVTMDTPHRAPAR